jgi:hypothetical protein
VLQSPGSLQRELIGWPLKRTRTCRTKLPAKIYFFRTATLALWSAPPNRRWDGIQMDKFLSCCPTPFHACGHGIRDSLRPILRRTGCSAGAYLTAASRCNNRDKQTDRLPPPLASRGGLLSRQDGITLLCINRYKLGVGYRCQRRRPKKRRSWPMPSYVFTVQK